MVKEIKNVVTWLKNWFYDKTEVYAKSETYTKEEVNTALGNKVNVAQGSGNSDKNVVTNSSGNITTEPKVSAGSGLSLSNANQMSHSNSVTALTTSSAKKIKHDAQGHITETTNLYGADIPVSSTDATKLNTALGNKIDSAGTGLSKSGTTLNHSNSVTAQSSAVFKKITYDGQGHITGTANVASSDLPSHTHVADNVYDEDFEMYENIGAKQGSQCHINYKIDEAIGELQSIKAIEVVSTKPTASADTMGSLYIVSENSKVNVYYTKRTGTSPNYTYTWQKMDTDILDELSINWSDIQNNPFSSASPSDYASSTHSHGIITSDGNCSGTTIDSAVSSFLGVNPTTNAIGRYSKLSETHIKSEYAYSNIGTSANATQQNINSAINVKIGDINTSLNNRITSIALVPKGSDPTADAYNGVIRLYYGDEPSS